MKRRNFIKTNLVASLLLALPKWMTANTNTDLPNVLILGDSISMGYTPFVKEDMSSFANVYRPMLKNGRYENCQGTTNGIKNIDRWIGTTKWDLIHFNFGLHDLKHVDAITGKNSLKKDDPVQADLKQYKKNMKRIVKTLINTNAKLIFASTTPYPENPDGPLREFGSVEKYNDVAQKIMQKNGVMIHDLYSFVLPRMKELQIPNNVHFTKSGSQVLGKKVADYMRNHL